MERKQTNDQTNKPTNKNGDLHSCGLCSLCSSEWPPQQSFFYFVLRPDRRILDQSNMLHQVR